jgi:hypothetical protein
VPASSGPNATGRFFVCDTFDAAPKGDMAALEHPVFAICTKPDKNIRRHENGDIFVEVVPSVKGLATVYDRDILIVCISQVIAALNDGREVNQTVRFKAFDLLSSRYAQKLVTALIRRRFEVA